MSWVHILSPGQRSPPWSAAKHHEERVPGAAFHRHQWHTPLATLVEVDKAALVGHLAGVLRKYTVIEGTMGLLTFQANQESCKGLMCRPATLSGSLRKHCRLFEGSEPSLQS